MGGKRQGDARFPVATNQYQGWKGVAGGTVDILTNVEDMQPERFWERFVAPRRPVRVGRGTWAEQLKEHLTIQTVWQF